MLYPLLKRKILKWWSRAPWLTLTVFLCALYAGCYAMMLWKEPPGVPIRSLAGFTYFFVITLTTVGFGDVVPVSAGGRMTASVLAVAGIGAVGVALGRVFGSMERFLRRRENGLLAFEMRNHIVIFGNRGAETSELIKQLIADQQSSGVEIVLCSQGTERNPFPDFIDFVKGELTSSDVLTRACVKDAGKVIIHARTDYESISVALAVKEINHNAPIVVKANDPGKEVDIERVDRNRVVCIKAIDVPMMVREIHNPGITQVLEKLLSSEGQDLRCVQVPPGLVFGFGPLAHAFREQHGAILIGFRPQGHAVNSGSTLNPAFHAVVEGGMFLDYISRSPLTVDWAELHRAHGDRK